MKLVKPGGIESITEFVASHHRYSLNCKPTKSNKDGPYIEEAGNKQAKPGGNPFFLLALRVSQ
jgi:hypothetical protein